MSDRPVEPLTLLKAGRFIDLCAAGLLVLAVVAAVAAPSPVAQVLAPALLLPFALVVFLLPRRSTTGLRGTTLVRKGLFRTKELDLRAADRVRLAGNGLGIAELQVWRDGVRSGHGLLSLNDHIREAVPAHDLTRLAEALGDRPVTAETVAVLRAQAAHLQSGGTLESSPLAVHTRGGLAAASGKAGAAGSLLDP